MIIESFFHSLLIPQLTSLGLNGKQRRLVCDDIHARLSSLISNWDDLAFRRTALLLGTEDATFYRPANVDLQIRALVAVGIRNSMLEDLSADRPYVKEFIPVARCLHDSFVPTITSEAVSFFASVYRRQGDLGPVKPTTGSDTFRLLAKEFPETWRRLELLANSDSLEHDLPNEAGKIFQPPSFNNEQPGRGKAKTTVLSGFAPNIDPDLERILGLIKGGKLGFFFTSTFKWLTRNPRKLLGVIESLLSWNRSFVTCNYLLCRDYCSKRQPLIRPPHTVPEMTSSMASESGMTERHRQCLSLVRQQYG